MKPCIKSIDALEILDARGNSTERMAQYNRLLDIERELGQTVVFGQ